MFETTHAAYSDANRVLVSGNIVRMAVGLGEILNVNPAPAAADYNNRRAARKLFAARAAAPIYRDRALHVR